MSATSSHLQRVINTAFTEACRCGRRVRIASTNGSRFLVVAGGRGRRVWVNRTTVLACQRWAVRDPAGAPLIFSLHGLSIAVLVPVTGMVVAVGDAEFYVVVRDRLQRIAQPVYRWLLALGRPVEDISIDDSGVRT